MTTVSTLVRAFAGTLIAFVVIDVTWISMVVQPMYDQQIAGLLRVDPRVAPAAIFYLAYAAGIVYFAVLPALSSGGVKPALVRGAVLGGLAYGTYACTNYAVLKGWTLALVVADVAWGIVLSAVAAACGLLAARPGR